MRLRDVGKTFLGRRSAPVVAFEYIDLEIRRGEFMAMVGPSGCGKSTLLQIVAGLTPPTSGQVLLGDKLVQRPPPELVYLFQQYSKSLFPWLTVGKNVEFGLASRSRGSRGDTRERVRSQLALVGLHEFIDHYPWQLSGGMQQRVAIARALAAEPDILLLDEPFSAVDALTRIELHALMLELWEKRGDLTVVLVTHDVDEAVYLADRVTLLTSRPARVAEVLEIGLARPREPIATREDPAFLEYRRYLLDHLLRKKPDAQTGE